MRTPSTLALLLAAAGAVSAQKQLPDGTWTGKRGDAFFIIDNPLGYVYQAVFPQDAFFQPAYPEGGNIVGSVTAEAAEPDGEGVRFNIKLSNLPATGGPFMYHIHAKPVPADGNCTATGAHLDPFERGQQPPCNASAPETCEVGDLSGKHGAIPEGSTSFTTSYVDGYASTVESYEGFIGNLSVVIHLANSTRVTCANFKLIEAPEGDDGNGDNDDDWEDGDDDYEEDDDDYSIPTLTASVPAPSSFISSVTSVTSVQSITTEPSTTTEPTSTSQRPVPTDILEAGAPAVIAKAGAAAVAAVVGVVFML